MLRIFIATLFAVAGAIQLVWGYFFGEPLVPFISNWLHSKGYSQMNANCVIGLICILIALLVWKFSKPKQKSEQKLENTEQDDRITRKQIKDSLAGFRIWIQALQGKLSEIPYYSYYDEKKQKLEQDYLDMDNQAYRILKDKVGNSEAVSFADEAQIPKVVAPPVANFDMPAFRDRWIDHKFMSNRLEYKKQQLEKTEAKLDSKDFILSFETSPNLFV
jgi:hypothetical protein